MQTIGIIGLGLIGGSIARTLKQKSPDTLIIAHNRTEDTLIKAQKEGIIDHYSKKINESFSACDIIFICVPVEEAAHIAELLKKHASLNTIVTDVGSTKANICQTMRKHSDSFTFIGGHPMAGSERSGYEASTHFLFENAFYLLSPYDDTPKEKTEELIKIIEILGAIPLVIAPEKHDLIVGAISHVPHVIAMALVNAVSKACGESGETVTLASGGFKDITRIASSSPKMWNDISFQNSGNILQILSVFKDTLSGYERSLSAGETKETLSLFERAKNFRDKFASSRPHSSHNIISLDLEDKPGGIAFITSALAYNGINIKNIGIINNRDFESGILEIVVESDEYKKKGVEILRKNGFRVKS